MSQRTNILNHLRLSTRVCLALFCSATAAFIATRSVSEFSSATADRTVAATLVSAIAQHEINDLLVPVTGEELTANSVALAERKLRLLAWISPSGEIVILRRRSALDLERLLNLEDGKVTQATTRSVFHGAAPDQRYQINLIPHTDQGVWAAVVDEPRSSAALPAHWWLGLTLSLGLVAASIWLARSAVAHPSQAISDLLTDLDNGSLSASKLPDELKSVGQRIEQLHGDIANATAKATHLENSLTHQVRKKTKAVNHQLTTVEREADTDALTGLLNRRAFERELPKQFKQQRENEQSLAAMVIDINHFKGFNDTLGHQAGDQLLKTVSEIIQANTRRGGELAFRYGGDEFILLIPGWDSDKAVALGGRLAAMLTQQVRTLPATDPPVGMSVGVAELSQHNPKDAPQLMKMADAAMYYAKRKQVPCMAIDVVIKEKRAGVKLPPRVSAR